MADVFLSYAREDRVTAEAIAAALKRAGWNVWWDTRITPGLGFEEVIERELTASRCVVVLWSAAAIGSSWVRNEAAEALERGVLAPVLIGAVKIPIAFRHVHTADLVGWDGESANDEWQRVLERIAALTSGDDAQPASLVDGRTTTSTAIATADSGGINQRGQNVARSGRSVVKDAPQGGHGRKWAAVGAASLAVALAMAFLLFRSKFPAGSAPASSDMNQEIVVDSSSAMSTVFGKEQITKLEAAVEALKTITLLKRDNVALRAFGGDCLQDNGSRMVVDFGTNRQNEVKTAAQQRLSPRGQPAMVFGVVSAIADVASFHNARRIIVLTGGDICPKEDLYEIKVRLDAAKLDPKDLDIRLIGLGVSAANKAKLRAIAKTVGGGAHFVDTIASLNNVLEWAVSFDSGKKETLNHADAVVEVVLAPTGPLNDFGDQLNLRNFEEARKHLDAAHASLKEGNERFDALAKTRSLATLQRLYELAADARSLHESDLQIGQKLVQYGEESSGRPERPATVDKWNAAIAQWLENTRKFNVTLKEIEQQMEAVRQETRRQR
jgi:hypothetical protein